MLAADAACARGQSEPRDSANSVATCYSVRSATWGPGLASDNKVVTFHTSLWLTEGASAAACFVTFTTLLIIPLFTDTKNCFKKKKVLNLLQHCFCFMFRCFGLKASGILALPPGIKPTSPPLPWPATPAPCIERRSLNHRATRKVVAFVSDRHSSRATAYLLMQARRKRIWQVSHLAMFFWVGYTERFLSSSD